MSTLHSSPHLHEAAPEVVYPESDGLPMSDNTEQFQWIVFLKENLDAILPDFVAGDLLWYPVQGRPNIRLAPDTMVALGRPKGRRGSYKQWEEDHVPPQVVFEVLSSLNSMSEMVQKGFFYAKYGAREFYAYDPDTNQLYGWLIEDGLVHSIEEMNGHISPLLQIRFALTPAGLQVFAPDGSPFMGFSELRQRARAAAARAAADQAHARAEAEAARAEQERQRAEQAEEALRKLQERMKALGIEP